MTIGTPGQRKVFTDLVLLQKTWYETKAKFPNSATRVVWRHAFIGPDQERIVYSGKWLPVEIGQAVNIKATIKRYENDFKVWRISRPRILPPVEKGML